MREKESQLKDELLKIEIEVQELNNINNIEDSNL